MAAFIVRRFLYMIVTLFFVSIIGFFIINLPEGNYIDVFIQERQMQGTSTSEAEIQAVIKAFWPRPAASMSNTGNGSPALCRAISAAPSSTTARSRS